MSCTVLSHNRPVALLLEKFPCNTWIYRAVRWRIVSGKYILRFDHPISGPSCDRSRALIRFRITGSTLSARMALVEFVYSEENGGCKPVNVIRSMIIVPTSDPRNSGGSVNLTGLYLRFRNTLPKPIPFANGTHRSASLYLSCWPSNTSIKKKTLVPSTGSRSKSSEALTEIRRKAVLKSLMNCSVSAFQC